MARTTRGADDEERAGPSSPAPHGAPAAEVESLELTATELRVRRWTDWRVLLLLVVALCCLLGALVVSYRLNPAAGHMPPAPQGAPAADGEGRAGPHRPDLLAETAIDVLRECAVAFFIAFVVVVTVETGSRRELNEAVQERIRKVQRNVFHSTFERHIPKRTVAEVNAMVFAASFVRLWHVADYTLRIVEMTTIRPGLPAMPIVEVEQVTSYVIRNVDAVARPFAVHASVERPPFPSLCDDQDINLTRIEWGGLEQRIPEPVVSPHTHHVEKRYDFGMLEPGATVRVELRARLFKLLNDYEIWRSAHPTDTVTLVIQLPREPVGYNVFSLHRLGLRELKLGPHCWRYETRGAMLPYQGILFWWRFDGTALGPPATNLPEPPRPEGQGQK